MWVVLFVITWLRHANDVLLQAFGFATEQQCWCGGREECNCECHRTGA